MAQISTIMYEGCKMAYLDAKNASESELDCEIKEFSEFCIQNKINHVIDDVSGAYLTPKVKNTANVEYKRQKEAFGNIYIVVIGASRIHRIIGNIFTKKVYYTDNMIDAMHWLAIKN